MPSEREPSRYEPLNETQRRVAAEQEEKRRIAEEEQARSAAQQSEPEPIRPGTEPSPAQPEATPDHDPSSPEARLAEKERELQERVRLGRINPSEMIHELRQFDNTLRIEMEQGGRPPPADPHSRQAERAVEVEREGQVMADRDDDLARQASTEVRDNPSERVPETRTEREAKAAEYEITGRGEMTDARAARLARLQNIDRAIEREQQGNDGRSSGLDHDSGDHSR